MGIELLKCNNYILLTFSTTSQALKAEKLLLSRQADFLLAPTLREISGSCGLSIRIASSNFCEYFDYLTVNKVFVAGTYRVVREGRINRVEPIITQEKKGTAGD